MSIINFLFWINFLFFFMRHTEAVAQRCSVKMVFLEISQNLQENTCARVSFLIKLQTLAQVFSCEFCEISKNTFSYRTPLVTVSDIITYQFHHYLSSWFSTFEPSIFWQLPYCFRVSGYFCRFLVLWMLATVCKVMFILWKISVLWQKIHKQPKL